MDAGTLAVLLPERRRLAGPIAPDLAARFGRADALPAGDAGHTAQLQRHFRIASGGWPLAAITREHQCGDARGHAWLRADPAYVRAEMSGVRLMGFGALGLDAAAADDLAGVLRPVFGDAGFALDIADAGRWHLRLPAGTPIPASTAPEDALGTDVFEYLPQGPEGRRWRALANEAQVLLHHHPLNERRVQAGLPPVNSLWFWGGGVLPDRVGCDAAAIIGDDFELRALARACGAADAPGDAGAALLDLRAARDWPRLEDWLRAEALPALGTRHEALLLDFADGTRVRLRARQRWRVWRGARDPRA